ncbi:universal stress protein UspA [Marinobacter salinus]|uniref:Universal stress protein UspA n=1 Tax=Marinobacter salinus TaxID=1874317 RepID=A0A1D9GR83_9GAMM|nr:universal stress protein [Marinobacter salinus]AOY90064.1 universal stress protein UspA [Marinobacter salinus]
MFNKILIAIDAEDDGEGKRALEEGVRLLSEGGELHLASVYSPGTAGFFPHVTEEAPAEKENEVRDVLNLLARKYLPLNQAATLHVVAGSAGEKLLAIAGKTCADLLILVSRGASGRWPLRRATVEYISVNAPCSVLVLPAQVKGTEETEEGR